MVSKCVRGGDVSGHAHGEALEHTHSQRRSGLVVQRLTTTTMSYFSPVKKWVRQKCDRNEEGETKEASLEKVVNNEKWEDVK